MRTPGIRPNTAVTLLFRSGDNVQDRDGLVLGVSMNPGLAGAKGEPSIEVIVGNPDGLKHVGTADWQNALIRLVSVVHVSHPSWMDGSAAIAYRDDTEAHIEDAAHIAHEANRVICAVFGDFSQTVWGEATLEQRNSIRNGVRRLLETPDISTEEQHARWMESMLANGWTYGPVRDPQKKQNPGLAPWHDLAPELKAKDHLFMAVARAAFDIPQQPLGQNAAPPPPPPPPPPAQEPAAEPEAAAAQ